MGIDGKNPFADRVGGAQRTHQGSPVASLDVLVANEQYVIEVDLPGIALDDIALAIADGELEIRAVRKRPDANIPRKDYAFLERKFGEIERTIKLPGAFGNITSKTLADGVLTIVVGRKGTHETLS